MKEALNQDSIDSAGTMSFRRVKGILMSRRKQWDYENIGKIIDNGSESMKHYVPVYVTEDQLELTRLLCSIKIERTEYRVRFVMKKILTLYNTFYVFVQNCSYYESKHK